MNRAKTNTGVAGLLATAMLLIAAGAIADDLTAPPPRAALGAFKAELKTALMKGLAAGPEQAIAACQIEAPAIAARLSGDGVTVGRSSHRLRNPANAPPDWVSPILAAYLDDPDARSPRHVVLPDGGAGYIEPIVMQPMCTACHGAQLSAGIAATINERYPLDQATGFAPGDLRGVLWMKTAAD